MGNRMTPLSPIQSFTPSSPSFGQLFSAAYPPLQSLGVLTYGLKEVVLDAAIPQWRAKRHSKLNPVDQKIHSMSLASLPKPNPKPFWRQELVLHGLLFVQSGLFGLAAAVRRHKLIQFGKIGALFDPLSRAYFLLANLLALRQSLLRFQRAKMLEKNPETFSPHEILSLKRSAVIGILAAIDYILLTAVAVIGFSSAILFFIAGLAATTGCLQVIYDFFRLPSNAF